MSLHLDIASWTVTTQVHNMVSATVIYPYRWDKIKTERNEAVDSLEYEDRPRRTAPRLESFFTILL